MGETERAQEKRVIRGGGAAERAARVVQPESPPGMADALTGAKQPPRGPAPRPRETDVKRIANLDTLRVFFLTLCTTRALQPDRPALSATPARLAVAQAL